MYSSSVRILTQTVGVHREEMSEDDALNRQLFDSESASGGNAADLFEEGSEDDTIAVQTRQHIELLQREVDENKRLALDSQRESARALITRVIKSPFERNKKIILLKSFIKWAKQIPLHQKCDELAGQLKDRLVAIASIRDSYLRDVVRVNYHLSKVKEFKFPDSDEEAFKKLSGHDMYDLHVVPSMSLKKLIDRATEEETSSMQLKETLIQAGLINVGTGKAYNAWEKGKMFKKVMKHNRGPRYKLPNTGGESISLATPQTHELFVRYCKDCVGVMQFVRAWNFEVEDSLRYKSEGQIMEREIENLKNTINSLNNIIQTQEQDIVDKEKKITLMKNSSQFMTQWSHSMKNDERERDLTDKVQKMRHERDMTLGDLESSAIETQQRRLDEQRVWRLRYPAQV